MIPAQPLTHMWERHHEIKRRLVLGERQVDIANDLGMTQTRMSNIKNSPLMLSATQELRDRADENAVDIMKRLNNLRDDALNALEEVLKKEVSPGDVPLRIKVAESVLDRTGFGKAGQIQGNLNVTLEQYVQQTLNQIGRLDETESEN
jgi:hypothetical protein